MQLIQGNVPGSLRRESQAEEMRLALLKEQDPWRDIAEMTEYRVDYQEGDL